MTLSSRIVLSLMATALPLGASAMVVAVSVGDVIGIVQTNKKPLAFDLGMKGTYGKASGNVSIKGTQNGNLKSLANAALEATIILDGKESAESWGHATFNVRLVHETLYVRLDDFSAQGEWAAYINMVEPYVDVWYSFPIDPEEYKRFMKSQRGNRNMSYRQIEALFKVVQEELRNGKTRYTLTIPKNRQRRLLSRLLGREYARFYRGATVDARLSVETLGNVFDSFTGWLNLAATVNGQKSTMKMTGKATTLRATPIIVVPANSTPFEDLLNDRYGSGNGARQIEDARNAQRRSDVNTILNAVYQYAIDHDGRLPSTLHSTTTLTPICATKKRCDGLSLDVLTGTYLVRIPMDPSQDTDHLESGYTIQYITDGSYGRISVTAPLAEGVESISVTR